MANFLETSASPSWLGNGGVGGTVALTYEHSSLNSGVAQYLDLSCLVEGDVREFEASYRVIDTATGFNQNQTSCQGGMEVYCIHAWIEFRENDNSQLGNPVGSMRQTLGRPESEQLVLEGSSTLARLAARGQ